MTVKRPNLYIDANGRKTTYSRQETDKEVFAKAKIDVDNIKNTQLFSDTIEGVNDQELSKIDTGNIATVDRPIAKKQTMKSLNNKFNNSKTQSKASEKLQNYVEHGVVKHHKSRSKYLNHRTDESEKEIAFEEDPNILELKNKSDNDACSVDNSQWNLSIREKLKKRSSQDRQVLLTSREAIDKLEYDNYSSNKHNQSQHEKLKEQRSLETIKIPLGSQLLEKRQMYKGKKASDNGKNHKIKNSKLSNYSESMKNEQIKRNVVEVLKKKKSGNLIKMSSSSTSNKLKGISQTDRNEILDSDDNHPGSVIIHDIENNSIRYDNCSLVEHENSLVNKTQIESLKYDQELGILGKVISHQKHAKVREISKYRETKQKIKSKKFISAEEHSSADPLTNKLEDLFVGASQLPAKSQKLISHKKVPSKGSSSSSQKKSDLSSHKNQNDKELATLTTKKLQIQLIEDTEEKKAQKHKENQVNAKINLQQNDLKQLKEKAIDFGMKI